MPVAAGIYVLIDKFRDKGDLRKDLAHMDDQAARLVAMTVYVFVFAARVFLIMCGVCCVSVVRAFTYLCGCMPFLSVVCGCCSVFRP